MILLYWIYCIIFHEFNAIRIFVPLFDPISALYMIIALLLWQIKLYNNSNNNSQCTAIIPTAPQLFQVHPNNFQCRSTSFSDFSNNSERIVITLNASQFFLVNYNNSLCSAIVFSAPQLFLVLCNNSQCSAIIPCAPQLFLLHRNNFQCSVIVPIIPLFIIHCYSKEQQHQQEFSSYLELFLLHLYFVLSHSYLRSKALFFIGPVMAPVLTEI